MRQVPIGPYFADFCCREAKLVIEVDGATHSKDAELLRDAARTRFLASEGFRVLRFDNVDVYENIDAVCDTIFATLGSRS